MASLKHHLRTVMNQDGAAILDTEQGTISTLNRTGAYIWQALERGESETTIVAALARETGQSPDTIKQDLSDFLTSLREQKLFR